MLKGLVSSVTNASIPQATSMDTVVKIEALAIMPSVIKSKTLLSVSGNKKKPLMIILKYLKIILKYFH